jgi:hypothetical protein
MRFLNPKCGLALGATVVAALLLSWVPFQSQPGQTIDTRGWTLTNFVEHLRQHGVQLHVVPGTSDGSCGNNLYLTENPHATWLTMQGKHRVLERIQEWHGTVVVWYAHPDIEEESVAEWGPHRCRIGRFVLFGDEAVLLRILEVCRS